jgi:hypothetical protein
MAEKKIIELEVKNNLGSLKSQLREAQAEVAKLSEQFGVTSKQVIEAAKRAAELKDRIEDANDTIQSFKGEGAFLAAGKAINVASSGIASYQGALGLLGVESEKVQETLLKVQSAMALTQGLAGLEDAGRAFTQLGAVIKNQVVTAFTTLKGAIIATGIGALVVTIGFLLPKIMEWIDGTKELERKQNDLNRQIDNANNLYKKNTEEIDRNINAELRLAKARGASEQDLLNIEKKGQKQRVDVQKRTVEELDKLIKQKRNLYIEAYVDEDWDRAKALQKEQKDLQIQRSQILKDKKLQNEELLLRQQELTLTQERERKTNNQKVQAEIKEQVKKEEETYEESFNRRLKMQEEIDSMRLKPKSLKDDPNSITAKAISDTDELMKIQIDSDEKKLAQLQKTKEEEKAIEEDAKNTKIRMAYDSFSVIQGVADLFAQGNEEDQKKAFQLNKAVNIGQAIMNTAQGVTAALSGGGNLGKVATGFNFVEAGLIGTIGALNIAKIANTQFQGGNNAGGGNTPIATAPRTPSFDIIQAQPQMQLGALQQQPIKAYVVSGEVSTAQALDRNRVRNATF